MRTFKLDNEPKIESGFKIPEHYFENFSSIIMEKMPEDEIKVIPVTTYYPAERKKIDEVIAPKPVPIKEEEKSEF